MPEFQSIAIVGRGCILPGCDSADALWQTVSEGRNQVTGAPAGDWRVSMDRVLGGKPGRYAPDQTWSDAGGYIRGFDAIFDPGSTALDAGLVRQLDPVFQWSLYAARQALGELKKIENGDRAGVVLGNLSYPTRSHNQFAEREWISRITSQPAPAGKSVHAWNRFMSGLPAMVVAKAFGMTGGSLALDAACASGLYAIKMACDRLQDGRADFMLAGAVNAADQLFLHIGFSALNAMSRTGQSRPFHQDADGLVPSEGAAFVALKRLDDAMASGDRILGVIRGIGLSNDGRSGGFLSPSKAGQVRCMQDALAQANLAPGELQYIECHATGTPTGDATEIASLSSVYGQAARMPIGSLKANLGHLITTSGVAGLIKVLSAMEHGEVPGTPGIRPLTNALEGTNFDVPEANSAWPENQGQRTAAVSSFGFGGNNAHLIVQQFAPKKIAKAPDLKHPRIEFAIVGLGVRTHLDVDTDGFARRMLGPLNPPSLASSGGDFSETISLEAKQLAFPPADLKQALGQQLILLDVVKEATQQLSKIDAERTGIYVGMQTDSEVCRYGLRWRWPDLMQAASIDADATWLKAVADALAKPLDSAGVIGKMPNVPANRLNNQMNICGPGFTVSREELSGDAALSLACTAIARGEIDTALVAAVDLCREEVHEAAAHEALGPGADKPADAAVMLVIKSLAHAQRDGDKILGVIGNSSGYASAVLKNTADESPIRAKIGHAHAASGLLHIALGTLMLRSRSAFALDGSVQPMLRNSAPLQASIRNMSFGGETAEWMLREAPLTTTVPLRVHSAPQIVTFAAADVAALIECVKANLPNGDGPCRLAIVGDAQQLDGLRQKALQGLASKQMGDAWSLDGISFRSAPIQGELAYAFTGAASAYQTMGRELLLAIPQLADGLSSRLQNVDATVSWAFDSSDGNDERAGLPFNQLAGSSFLCQLHTELSRNVLGLKPTVSLGLSSGETNGMYAFGVWSDIDSLFTDIQGSGLYTAALANTFDAVRKHWGLKAGEPIDWENYRLRAPVSDVLAAVKNTARVYVTIINSPTDSVIGGDQAACQAVMDALGNPAAVALGHDLAIHCEPVLPFEPAWRKLHTRPTKENPNIRFYSNFLGGVFKPTKQTVADALTGQALQTIDFPKIVHQAWNDGVRIFVEHGPRNSLSTAIDEILGDKSHLAVALDRSGVSAIVQAFRAAAQLWCAGVEVDLEGLRKASSETENGKRETLSPGPMLQFRLRPEKMKIPSLMIHTAPKLVAVSADVYVPPILPANQSDGRLMAAAPALGRLGPLAPTQAPLNPPMGDLLPTRQSSPIAKFERPVVVKTSPALPLSMKPISQSAAPILQAENSIAQPEKTMPADGVMGLLLDGHRQMVEAHNAYLQAQAQGQQAYAESMARIQSAFFAQGVTVSGVPATAVPPPAIATPRIVAEASQKIVPASPIIAKTPPVIADVPKLVAAKPPQPGRALPGPKFSRQQLEVLAGGQISSVLGAEFAPQDQYAIQVRMPEPPLLLCDRVMGIEGNAQSMGQGTIWTETDVREDSWYVHHGRMPAGVFIESGQADLLLISWLGIDTHNKGDRAYRLLGCDLVFHGDLPQPGDTLQYEIHVDGHAKQGDVRLFFFHYDCHINGELRISVRNGQAGFFTKQELLDSSGVIWTPETAKYSPDAKVAPAPVPTQKSKFTSAEVDAYLNGDLETCFGEEFYWANTHTRSPRTPADKRNFLGEVTQFDLTGGPKGRGYMRLEKPVHPDDWFFEGHFKNDPCMPGTLMAEACLQAMAFYMAGTGRTLQRDGWRYQPVRDTAYKFVCRGQVTPESKHLVYELFIDEIIENDMPMLYAHVLCSVDGRKAFLCERLGVQLVPDWPLSSMPEYLVEKADARPLAKIGDFPLDYRSLIHCAWGKPSRAFGKGFSRYDGTGRSPRLPGPPYHFMTRITDLHGEMAEMKPGAKVTAVYDLDDWFFKENASPTMPNAVLMEIALQPCGWLASYTLKRKEGDAELLFRNLDGDAVQHREITPNDRSITTEVELLSVSKVGDLIIEKFAVRCSIENVEVLKVETVFGFFPPAAMENQKGFPTKEDDRKRLELPSETRIDLRSYPKEFFGGAAKLPASKLLMIDRISGYWPQGGKLGLGAIRAEKDVNAKEWFFKAHFFQDPVQPGSLGIEAMLQAMQSFMLLEGMAENIEGARFEPIDIGGKTVWHYRGQVTPLRERITTELEIIERGTGERGPFIIADARLWVDGLQIYHAPRIGMRIVRGPKQPERETPNAKLETSVSAAKSTSSDQATAGKPPAAASAPAPRPTATVAAPIPKSAQTWRLDVEQPIDKWILDHCPTYTLPSLPLTYELELMALAAAPLFKNAKLLAIETADAKQWVAFPTSAVSGLTLVDVVSDSQVDVTLQSKTPADKYVTAATARMRFGPSFPKDDLPALAPLQQAAPVDDPYAAGTLFHGPSLQLMRNLTRGTNGAKATLDAKSRGVPIGLLHPGMLDAALHCIPHDDYRQWCPQIVGDLAAYPVRIENFRLFGTLEGGSDVDVHARFVALESGRFPRTHLRLTRGGRVLVAFDLVEVLLPKGRLGSAPAIERRAFLRDHRFVPGMALSDVGRELTQLKRPDVARSDWLPGTLASVYGVNTPGADLAIEIAVGDHAGQHLRLHPGDVQMNLERGKCLNLPLNRFGVDVAAAGGTVTVRSADVGPLNWELLHQNWLTRMNGESSFILDLGIALIRRFVRRVVLADPQGYAELRGKPVLYLANHQTGVESFLFLSIIASLSKTTIGAIAKQEHRDSWIGSIHKMAELAMGERNPLRMLFFNRTDQGDMLRILNAFGDGIAKDPCSLLVHVDGTRAQASGAPVRGVSSVLIDLAVKYGMPIVPVRFAGGLPAEPVDEKLEFPVAYGRQDFYLGRAIPAQLLGKMPYAQRARYVADRINNLGPLGAADVPLASDAAFQKSVATARAAGLSEVQAALRAALSEFPASGAETQGFLHKAGAPSADVAMKLARELIGQG